MDRLVDMVLSLLAQASGQLPSAPLRDAVEGLFRLFASQLTSTGAIASHATSTSPNAQFLNLSSVCCGSPVACCWASTALKVSSEHIDLYSILMLELRQYMLTCAQPVLHAEHGLRL